MPKASDLTANLLIEIPKHYPHMRVWRQNTGGGVGMEHVKKAQAHIRAGRHAEALACLQRPMKFGVLGGGDISGLCSVAVVGHTVGIRLEIEVKAGGDFQSEQQKAFQSMIEVMGGIYIVARSVEQCLEDLRPWR